VKIKLIAIGKTNIEYIQNGILEYSKRLQKYINFEILELNDVKNSKSINIKDLKLKEYELFDKNIKSTEDIILLDENGKEFTSVEFSKFIDIKTTQQNKDIVFLIGGAYGFYEEFSKSIPKKISISKMTFSHQMIRLLFTEQLYRAFTIIKGEPYHHQ